MSKNDRSVNYEWRATYSGRSNNWNNREMYSLQNLYEETAFFRLSLVSLFPLKLSADFSLLQLPVFGQNALFLYSFIQKTMQEQGKPSGTCMFGSGWEGGWVTVSMSEQGWHLVGTYLPVLVLQRQPEITDRMHVHSTISGNTTWAPHLPLAMSETPTQEGYSEVKILTSG